MSRYNEIIEEFDVEVCTPVTTQVRKQVENTKSWCLYRLDLMYVYPMGEDHICHRRYATKMVVAKDDEANQVQELRQVERHEMEATQA